MVKGISIALFFSLAFLSAYAQTNTINKRSAFKQQYTIENGLPTNEVYGAVQDNFGLIYLFSDRGITKCDGSTFNTLNKANGLPENVVTKGKKDAKGRLWFSTLNNKLFYLQDSIVEIKLRKIIGENGVSSKGFRINDFYVDGQDVIHILSSKPWGESLYYRYSLSGKLEIDTIVNTRCSFIYKHFKDGGTIATVNYRFKGTSKFVQDTLTNGILGIGSPKNNKDIWANDNVFSIWKWSCALHNDTTYYSFENNLFNVKDSTYEVKIDNGIINQLNSLDGKLYASTSKGLWYLKNQTPIYAGFKKERLASTFKDIDGNIWVSTLTKGVSVLPNSPFKVLAYDQRSSVANKSFNFDDENLYIGRQNGSFLIYNRKHNRIDSTIQIEPKNKPLDDITIVSSDSLIITRSGMPYLYRPSNYSYKLANIGSSPNVIMKNGTDTLVGLKFALGTICLFDKELNYIYRSIDLLNNRLDFRKKCHALYYDSLENHYLIGSFKGVHIFNRQNISYTQDSFFSSLNTNSVSAIDRLDNLFAFGTKGSGILIKEGTNEVWVNQLNGLQNLDINTLLIYNKNTLFAGTNNGVFTIDITDFEQPKILRHNESNGLLGNQILDIKRAPMKSVFVLTDKAVLKCGVDDLTKSKKVPLLFNGFFVDDVKHKESTLVQDFNENQVKITFKSYNFSNSAPITYGYKIHPLNNTWIRTKEPTVNLTGLRPGQYEIEFAVLDVVNNTPLSTVTTANYVINKPYYLTTSFLLLAGLFLSFLIFLFVRVIIYRINIRAELKTQLIDIENNALRAQMNPHFFFNTLNSIQSFIASNDKKKAFEYISKFANLVRVFLNQSNTKETRLTDELNSLVSYIQLEQMRLEYSFEYKIHKTDTIKSQIETLSIPTMILQPIIENAILHGLRAKKMGGVLDIFIKDENKHFSIEIRDNGIGRKSAERLKLSKNKNHQSMGLDNINRRIELLNKNQKDHISLKTTDLFDNDNKPLGTSVIFKFPFERYGY